MGSSIKKVHSVFVILDHHTSPVSAYTLLAYTSPPLAYGLYFFKEDMTEIYFVNYYQSKNYKHRSKIKKLLDKAFKKYRVKTPDRALGSSLDFEYRRDGKG